MKIEINEQIELFHKSYNPEKMKALSFTDSKNMPGHRWYPYVEGFSAEWIQEQIAVLKPNSIIYDPFGGSGTTPFEASKLGITSYFSEINPFMVFVTDTKVNAAGLAKDNLKASLLMIESYKNYLQSVEYKESVAVVQLDAYYEAFPDRNFFEEEHIKHLLKAKNSIKDFNFPIYIDSLILLAITSIAVESSNMTRRADLRRRKANEYKDRVVNVEKALILKLNEIITDLLIMPNSDAKTIFLSNDARTIMSDFENSIDFAITSPPYLNGTNYIRNTKIEIWLADFIKSEKELSKLREKTVCGGITDVVASRKKSLMVFPFVESVAEQLDEVAYDKRIPLMVRSYATDMYHVMENVYTVLKPGSKFVLDIGDSKFSGVHVPTDQFLIKLAGLVGFKVKQTQVLAKRYSRDKTELTQVAITFEK